MLLCVMDEAAGSFLEDPMSILPLVCINTKHRTQSSAYSNRIANGWENEIVQQVKVLATQAGQPEFKTWNLYKYRRRDWLHRVVF